MSVYAQPSALHYPADKYTVKIPLRVAFCDYFRLGKAFGFYVVAVHLAADEHVFRAVKIRHARVARVGIGVFHAARRRFVAVSAAVSAEICKHLMPLVAEK